MNQVRLPVAALALLLIVPASAWSADHSAAQGSRRPESATDYEKVVFVDYGEYFHGGPPPHTATAAATDFRLTMGGISWPAGSTVTYTVSSAGCTDDCAAAVGQVDAGLDAWEVSGVTFTRNDASPGANPCGGVNSVSWAPIDSLGRILAVASACRNPATKQILGFAITLDSGDLWSDSGAAGRFDIRAVVAHEGGHATGLDHASPPRASRLTMFPRIASGDTGLRTLGCGDWLGINALYATSLSCGPVPLD